MATTLTEAGSHYSQKMGFVYVFNLIVGTGALTMPRAFASAGWVISTIGVTVLAFMSYVTLTFVIEAMAVANAVLKLKQPPPSARDVNVDSSYSSDRSQEEDENKPLLRYPHAAQNSMPPVYGHDNSSQDSSGIEDSQKIRNPVTARHLSLITMRVEMGQMASLFYPYKLMLLTFYIVICIYLYGDLAIYAAAVPKSIRDVACTFNGFHNSTDNTSIAGGCNPNLTDSDICWSNIPSINRGNAYRIFLGAFILTLGPFLFFNVQKTKYLQLFTTLMRWLSFCMMIILTVIQLSKGYGEGRPPIADFTELPTLFGVCVYSFMCHHSLPSLVTPIKDKSRVHTLFAGDYALILVFYSVLSFTGIFTFNNLQDLYTLNFFCDTSSHPVTNIAFIKYFLALFPVFTLSTNFPIIGVTLRNNLSTLGHLCIDSIRFEKVIFPLLAIIPPVVIAFATSNVTFLVGITGSYAGAGIQYMIPVALVYFARKQFKSHFGDSTLNSHKSPFSHIAWLVIVAVWFLICITFVTVHHIISKSFS